MKSPLSRELIAVRIAGELEDGDYVNLGIGMPTLVSNYVPEGIEVVFHAENGILGYGPIPGPEESDADLVNAGSQPVTVKPGAAFFDSALSFAMIRSRHISVAVLGAYQVSEKGDLANWVSPERGIGSPGGTMDLVAGARRVIVAMEHTTKSGEPRLVRECSCPLTGRAVVDLIVTNLAVIQVTPDGLLLKEVAPGFTPAEIQAVTGAHLAVAPDIRTIKV